MNHTLSAQRIRYLMRTNHKTIRGVAEQWNLTQTRVRHVRNNGVSGEAFVLDWLQFLSAPAEGKK